VKIGSSPARPYIQTMSALIASIRLSRAFTAVVPATAPS
jgi:hypothetical protein